MKQKVCKNCRYMGALPFANEAICENPNGLYADCPCDPENDTCDDYEEVSDS